MIGINKIGMLPGQSGNRLISLASGVGRGGMNDLMLTVGFVPDRDNEDARFSGLFNGS
jgi:hypothetical protein